VNNQPNGRAVNDPRIPPQDLTSERALIGSILLDRDSLDEVRQIIHEGDFYSEPNRLVYAAIVNLEATGVPADDTVLIATELASTGKLDEVGGQLFLHELLESVPHGAHATFYAKEIHRQARRRQIIRTATDAIRDAHDLTQDVEDVAGKLSDRMSRLLEDDTQGQAESIGDVLLESFAEIMAGKRAGLSTGWLDLDEVVMGLQPGNLIVVAARPSMGKTALATDLLSHFAREHGQSLIFSLEQSKLELAERMLSAESGVNGTKIRSNTMTDDERDEVLQAATRLGERPIIVDDTGHRTVSEMASVARVWQRKGGLSLIVVDYLQLVTPADSKAPREQQVARISRELKLLAKDLGVPVILLAQLNRQVEARDDRKPRLSDLRESGAVEQDADGVWMIYRPGYYGLKKTKGEFGEKWASSEAFVVVAKNRNGESGKDVAVNWDAPTMTFRSAATVFCGGEFAGTQ